MTYGSDCTGAAWWQVDLGGVYNLTRVVLFNRYPFTVPQANGASFGVRLAGATLQYLNYYGNVIGSQVLNGSMIQTYTVTTYPPTPSITNTASVSATATSSHTPANTHSASRTPVPTPSKSYSSTTTGTPSPTVSRCGTRASFELLGTTLLLVSGSPPWGVHRQAPRAETRCPPAASIPPRCAGVRERDFYLDVFRLCVVINLIERDGD